MEKVPVQEKSDQGPHGLEQNSTGVLRMVVQSPGTTCAAFIQYVTTNKERSAAGWTTMQVDY